MKPGKKKGLVILLCAVAAVAAIAGFLFAARSGREPVKVYPFRFLGMTEYWGDSRESYGPVSTDKVQTVFLSDTQTVTEILVKPGDVVKKGDILMTFDTTLDDLALERKRLAVEKLKLQQRSARERLTQIQNMVPMTVTEDTEADTGTVDTGTALVGSHQIFAGSQYNGSSPETAMICWLRRDTPISQELLTQLRQRAAQYAPEMSVMSSASAELVLEEVAEEVAEEVVEEQFLEEAIEEDSGSYPEEDIPEEPEPTEEPEIAEPPAEPSQPTTQPTLPEEPETQPEETEPTSPEIVLENCYVVFKVTEDNMSLGTKEVWQGVQILGDGTLAIKLFNADAVPDHSVEQQEEIWEDTLPEAESDSGYTAAEIAQMRSEQEKTIQELSVKIDLAEAEYKLMQAEVNDGHVYAKIDGEVLSVLSEEEARGTKHPIVKLSGGGGFYIEGSISELEMEGLAIGQEVTVNDWNTGASYTGEVIDLRDFPANQDGWNGSGNPNVSYYPFRVFVDGEADLQEGSYVSVLYSSAAAQSGIYLENAFLRTEQGRHYVWLRGSDGKLEQRFVTAGKSLWGSYSEILSGITEEDLLAFPYGKGLKAGVPTVEADISELYAY